MKPILNSVFIPHQSVRWLGVGLIVAGLGVPFATLVIRAASWRPLAVVEAEIPSLRPEMVILPGGSFMMGSPEDEEDRDDDEGLHQVTLTGFSLARTEVTQGQFFAVLGERPVETRKDVVDDRCADAGVGDDRPVVCVTWLEAVRYCNQLSLREGLDPAYRIDGEAVSWQRGAPGYRLPTEAEWEYAARAGTRDTWVGTDRAEEVCVFANVADASAKEKNPGWEGTFACDDAFPALAPVGSHQANRWHLFGLGGNAAEWVWDTYGPYPEEREDPVADQAGAAIRVFRGGSWGNDPRYARVANRDWDEPSGRIAILGFRVARSLPSTL